MKFGFVIPGGELKTILGWASEAEKAGWDAVFYWDGIYIERVRLMYDAWTVLAAVACRTKKIKIGAMLTAVNRRRPWKLAREATTVDHLSHGRLIIPVGLGALDDGGYSSVGEPTDRKSRAELLDEGLDILNGLWSSEPFSYKGKHYTIEKAMTFRPAPLQKPRIPIWVVGAWPRSKSMIRALKYDGLIPTNLTPDGTPFPPPITIEQMREIRNYVRERRPKGSHFDIIHEGQTPLGNRIRGNEIVKEWKEAGATWWIETRWSKISEVLPRIKQGPPEAG